MNAMKELLRTNNLVRIAWIQSALAAEGIDTVLLDSHMSVIEGSIGALPRRLMVRDADHARAKDVLRAEGELP